MLKRNKGYFLLIMLVLTGLAGRMHTTTLTGKERRYLVSELKSSKSYFLESFAGLSKKQLSFRPGKNQNSIRDWVLQAAAMEKALATTTLDILHQPLSDKKIDRPDESQLASIFQQVYSSHPRMVTSFKTIDEAVDQYKDRHSSLLRYARTSTDNVRGHGIQTEYGPMDAYQHLLLTTVYTDYFTRQIQAIKANPRFPR